MKRKILIEKTEGQIRTFFLEDGDIVEIHCADADQDRAGSHRLGDIYIGKVKNIVPNIGAAFVEIENGISCYYDMKDVSLALFTNKTGKKPLCIGDELVVQISKEAVKTKAPTVTGNISFTGRYAVLTHGNTRIGVSSKLPKNLRDDYKEKLRQYQNDSFGIIVRTNAKDASFQDVLDEIETLRSRISAYCRHCPHKNLLFLSEVSAAFLYIRSEKCLYGGHGRNSGRRQGIVYTDTFLF